MNDTLNWKISNVSIPWDSLNVQEHWNVLEDLLISTVDYLVPFLITKPSPPPNKPTSPPAIQSKINTCKCLLKCDKMNNNSVNDHKIKLLNVEIRSYFVGLKVSRVRSAAMGGGINLWKAVKLAKNLLADAIPTNLTLGGKPIATVNAADAIALYFHEKEDG